MTAKKTTTPKPQTAPADTRADTGEDTVPEDEKTLLTDADQANPYIGENVTQEDGL